MTNTIDKYFGWTKEMINADLRQNAHPFAVLFEQIRGDFNIGTGIRNSNAFNALEVFYYGPRKKFDRRGAVGTYHYVDLKYLPTIEDVKKLKEKYTFVGVDCIPGSIPMESFVWPKNTLMCFGEEGSGLSKEIIELCDVIVHITQYGSVRSLNVGTASGIAMYDFVNKLNK
jgi:tRNA G18 (ribose-2'-O)-methylase SpoU